MKDKLRELAERWNHQCNGYDRSYDFLDGKVTALSDCADELLEILDAEGDGGVVSFIVTDAKGKKFTIYNQLLAEAIRHIAKEKGSTLRVDAVCTIPDYGWFCTRGEGHDGPCAAWPNSPTDKCPTCGGPATRHEVGGAFEMRDEYRHAKQSARPARSGVVSDEDVRDAARYRWLRGRNVGDGRLYEVIHDDAQPGYQGFKYEEELDQAIDAAIQGERHEP